MKKLICFFLAVVMGLCFGITSFASDEPSEVFEVAPDDSVVQEESVDEPPELDESLPPDSDVQEESSEDMAIIARACSHKWVNMGKVYLLIDGKMVAHIMYECSLCGAVKYEKYNPIIEASIPDDPK